MMCRAPVGATRESPFMIHTLDAFDAERMAHTDNPFQQADALENSRYFAFEADKLVSAAVPPAPVPPLAEFVHDGFRALVLNSHFTCVAAKSAFNKDNYRFAMYENDLASPGATAGLARDLYSFLREQDTLRHNGFSTFVASFSGPTITGEKDFEQRLWQQLQELHELDAPFHDWDSSVSDDPNDPHFEFSFAARAFFVVGMHPASSRWTRRFAWPTLVFNAHFQFEELRQSGKYGRMQDVMRTRDRQLQGSINANLADYRRPLGRAPVFGASCRRRLAMPLSRPRAQAERIRNTRTPRLPIRQ